MFIPKKRRLLRRRRSSSLLSRINLDGVVLSILTNTGKRSIKIQEYSISLAISNGYMRLLSSTGIVV